MFMMFTVFDILQLRKKGRPEISHKYNLFKTIIFIFVIQTQNDLVNCTGMLEKHPHSYRKVADYIMFVIRQKKEKTI